MGALGAIRRGVTCASSTCSKFPRNPQVLTDDLRVRQIVMNGLTNAIKYSNAPENGAILVCVRADEDDAGAMVNPVRAAARRASAVVHAGVPPRALLCIDVLDHGHGLGGVDESAMFSDFAAPLGVNSGIGQDPQTGFRVGSSGVGLPVCFRCARMRQWHTRGGLHCKC